MVDQSTEMEEEVQYSSRAVWGKRIGLNGRRDWDVEEERSIPRGMVSRVGCVVSLRQRWGRFADRRAIGVTSAAICHSGNADSVGE